MKEAILDQLLTLQYATINNFYSPKSNNPLGALNQVTRDFKSLIKNDYVKPIPMDERPHNKRQETFYQVTHKGAHRIDRLEDYKGVKEMKSVNNVKHESSKIDVVLSFLRNYPEYDIEVSYSRVFGNIKPDIYLKLGDYHFIIEIERKRKIHATLPLLDRYKKIKNDLPKNAKVLIVWNNIGFNPFIRPQEYTTPIIQSQKAFLDSQFESLIKKASSLPPYFFRFLPFYEFPNLHTKVWRTPRGEIVKLIDKEE